MTIETVDGSFVVENVVTLAETSPTAVAVASHEGAIHLAWTDADLHLNTVWSADGDNFTGRQRLHYRSYGRSRVTASPGVQPGYHPLPPSLTGGHTGLWLAWAGSESGSGALLARRGAHGDINVLRLGQTATGPAVAGGGAATRPSIAAWGDGAALAWIGADGTVNLTQSHGSGFSPPTQFGKAADMPTGLGTLGRELVLAWISTRFLRSQLNIAVSQAGRFGEPIVCRGVGSPVSICGLGNELVVTWREHRHRRTNIGFLRNGALVAAARLLGGPLLLPVCAHGDGVVVAWPGGDSRINIAHLRRTA